MEEYLLKLWYNNDKFWIVWTVLTTIFSIAPILYEIFDKKYSLYKFYKWVGYIAILILFCLFTIDKLYSSEQHYNNAFKFLKGIDGFSIDNATATAAFKIAAEKGHPLSCFYLGQLLLNRGDDFSAIKTWEKGIKLGDSNCARMLGEFYEHYSTGLPENRNRELAYITYYLGGCLGDESLRIKAHNMRTTVSLKTQGDAMKICAKLNKNRNK